MVDAAKQRVGERLDHFAAESTGRGDTILNERIGAVLGQVAADVSMDSVLFCHGDELVEGGLVEIGRELDKDGPGCGESV